MGGASAPRTIKELLQPRAIRLRHRRLDQIVEGQLQMIPLSDGRIMTFNEDGGPDAKSGRAGLPPNEQATKLAGFSTNAGPLGALRGFAV